MPKQRPPFPSQLQEVLLPAGPVLGRDPDPELVSDIRTLFEGMDEEGRLRMVEAAAAADEAAATERLMGMSDVQLEGYVDERLSKYWQGRGVVLLRPYF